MNTELKMKTALQDSERAQKSIELAAQNKNKANELLLRMLGSTHSALTSEVSEVSTGVEIYA